MKIIGEANERFIVSLTENELANVMGLFSKYDLLRPFLNNAIKKEIDIEISDIYKKHESIVRLQNTKDYDSARTKLRGMLEALTSIEDKISKFEIVPEKKKEDFNT